MAPPPPPVTAHLATFAPAATSEAELHAGREIFVGACAKCHGLDSPKAFEPRDWQRIVREMSEPAKLRGGQEKQLLVYLLSARAFLLNENSGRQFPAESTAF